MKKRIVLGLIAFLLFNFLAFWLSIWPYQSPVVISGEAFLTDYAAVKTNFYMYITISICSLAAAIISYKTVGKAQKREA